MIYDFINELCEIINIPVPSISFDTSNFKTDTMMAQIIFPKTNTIYLKRYNKPNPDQFFAIAHEIRHIWQLQNDEDLFFSNYKPLETCNSVEEYNLQLAELDANAFAGLVMMDFFNLQPLFQEVPNSVKAKIFERMEFLDETEFTQYV